MISESGSSGADFLTLATLGYPPKWPGAYRIVYEIEEERWVVFIVRVHERKAAASEHPGRGKVIDSGTDWD